MKVANFLAHVAGVRPLATTRWSATSQHPLLNPRAPRHPHFPPLSLVSLYIDRQTENFYPQIFLVLAA